METTFTVVGAGAVGLAAAAELAPHGSVLILEREGGIGQGVSSRNSQVVHAGIYYPLDSLRARLCVEGRLLIERWAAKGCFEYQRVGKLLVAKDAEEGRALESLRERALQNGVDDLTPLEGPEVTALEPDVRAHSGMLSPSTGILDGHGLLRHLLRRAEEHGAELALDCEVIAIEHTRGAYQVTIRQNGVEQRLRTRSVINAAGLHADTIVERTGLDPDAAGLRLHWIRGEYFDLQPSCPIRIQRLVYPVPRAAGHLGIHVTVDLRGRLRLGPSADPPERRASGARNESYAQDDRHREEFVRAVRTYLPALQAADLTPGGAALRPRLLHADLTQQEFYLREESDRGLPGLVNCIGIDSPGLTAAPAIGRHVARLLGLG